MTLQERMIPVYVLLVQAGRRGIDEVPEEIREQVRETIGEIS